MHFVIGLEAMLYSWKFCPNAYSNREDFPESFVSPQSMLLYHIKGNIRTKYFKIHYMLLLQINCFRYK